MVLSGCANMIPPTGGDRDSLPPVLVKVTPPDSTKGFDTRTITFTFDEYIDQPQDLFKNLIVSPHYTTPPVVEAKLRTLTVKIKDTLEPNTTYYYNFGDAIKDINEGNVLHNFSYIFTTGAAFDSLQLSGKVVLAETGGIDSTLIVMLHRSSEDSAVNKQDPRYYTKLDGKGNFRFQYFPCGTFYNSALEGGGAKRYYGGYPLFAFADSAVEVKPGVGPVTLYAFAEKELQATSSFTFGGGNLPVVYTDEKR